MKGLVFLLLIIITGCTQQPGRKTQPVNTDSLVKQKIKAADSTWRKEIADREKSDSIKLDSLLTEVMKLANSHNKTSPFHGEIDSAGFDDKNIFATFQFGNIFSADKKHLLVKRFIRGVSVETNMYSDIYLLVKNKFTNVVSDIADIGYSADTLLDVNSDGYPDYIVSSYSGTGCCPRDAQNGYLYNAATGRFTSIGFFNPEFNLPSKTFFESDYGYPGEVSIDKYQWQGLNKIKVESLFPNTVTGQPDSFIKPYSYRLITYPGEKEKVINTVPEEYKNLQLYDYFISYQR